jgi:signal transduction histidine kinase
MSRGTILVVEDDANLLAGIRDILELEKYTIFTASDGIEGLQILEGMPTLPDLIVSDIMMPHMDGIEFLVKVREREDLISIPFIYLTAKGEKSDIQRGKELGVDDYVVKPFNADELLVAIQSRMARSKAIEKVHQGRENQLKENILTILNHEFRTPLTFVVAYSDMLNDITTTENLTQDDREMLSFLNGVKGGADRLRRLVENFILLVEMETGGAKATYEMRKRRIDDLKSLITLAAEQAIVAHEGETGHYELTVDTDIPPFTGDEEYLQTALFHLIDNACKFSKPERTAYIHVYVYENAVCIEVKDQGRGIAPSEMDNIWNSFYQVDRPRYEDQGTGSGLAIVKGIAAIHGGAVDVESEQGVGSTFTLRIPIQNSETPLNGTHS